MSAPPTTSDVKAASGDPGRYRSEYVPKLTELEREAFKAAMLDEWQMLVALDELRPADDEGGPEPS